MSIIEEIKLIKESKKDLRKFGLTVGSVLLLIGIVLFFKRSEAAIYWGGIGIVLLAMGFAVPVILRPLNKIWMSLAIVLGWIMTRVILILLFYIALTPTGLIARLLGKDLLEKEIDKSAGSYWQKRERPPRDPQTLERQF